jgi:hypothetical protein
MLLMAPETLPWWSELSSEEAWNELVVIRCHSSFSEFSKLNWRLGRKLCDLIGSHNLGGRYQQQLGPTVFQVY